MGKRGGKNESALTKASAVHTVWKRSVFPLLLTLGLLSVPAGVVAGMLIAPAAVGAQAAAKQLGTVISVTGRRLVLRTSGGSQVSVDVDPATAILQLPAGSTNLKSATPAQLNDVSVGDRVLATGSAGADPAVLSASRVIVMKASEIASRNASQQADWQRRGVSGIVRNVEGPVLTIAAGQHTVKVQTSPATVFRRYAADSVSFSAAKSSTLGDVHSGDELSVRGDKAADGTKIKAEEVVTGTFDNLSGMVAKIDQQAQTLTLKDLVTKHIVTVQITDQSDLRVLPSKAARDLAARSEAGNGNSISAAKAQTSTAAEGPASKAARSRSAGLDLSRMLARLPQEKLADLKPGDAVLIVASKGSGKETLTAITLLSGVEPLLSSKSATSEPITLSPWTLGAPEGGASQ